MVSRTRYALPLSRSLTRKFDALSNEFELRLLGASAGDGGRDPRFRLVSPVRPRVIDGPLFYALLPFGWPENSAASDPTPSSPKAVRRPDLSSLVARSHAFGPG